MTWTDLLRKKITELEVDQKKAQKKLERAMAGHQNVGRKIELMCEIESTQKTIITLYSCIGRANEVTE